jgi:hypothetical protein
MEKHDLSLVESYGMCGLKFITTGRFFKVNTILSTLNLLGASIISPVGFNFNNDGN